MANDHKTRLWQVKSQGYYGLFRQKGGRDHFTELLVLHGVPFRSIRTDRLEFTGSSKDVAICAAKLGSKVIWDYDEIITDADLRNGWKPSEPRITITNKPRRIP